MLFDLVNKIMTKSALRHLINESHRKVGIKSTVILADRLKDLGYEYATISGISIAMKDMVIPSNKGKIINEAETEVKKIEDQYVDGLITAGEKYNKVVDIWAQSTEDVASEMMTEMAVERVDSPETGPTDVSSFNAVYMMSDSGARGSKGPDAAVGRHEGAHGKAVG